MNFHCKWKWTFVVNDVTTTTTTTITSNCVVFELSALAFALVVVISVIAELDRILETITQQSVALRTNAGRRKEERIVTIPFLLFAKIYMCNFSC